MFHQFKYLGIVIMPLFPHYILQQGQLSDEMLWPVTWWRKFIVLYLISTVDHSLHECVVRKHVMFYSLVTDTASAS